MGVGAEIKKAAIDSGYRLGDLAKETGLRYPYFSARLNGHKDFTTREISAIARALGTTGWKILRRAEEAEKESKERDE